MGILGITIIIDKLTREGRLIKVKNIEISLKSLVVDRSGVKHHEVPA